MILKTLLVSGLILSSSSLFADQLELRCIGTDPHNKDVTYSADLTKVEGNCPYISDVVGEFTIKLSMSLQTYPTPTKGTLTKTKNVLHLELSEKDPPADNTLTLVADFVGGAEEGAGWHQFGNFDKSSIECTLKAL